LSTTPHGRFLLAARETDRSNSKFAIAWEQSRCCPWWRAPSGLWRARSRSAAGDDLDLLLAVLGPIESAAAAAQVQVSQRRDMGGVLRGVSAEDTYAALLRPAAGGLACVWLAATAQHPRGDQIELYGERGTVKLDDEGRVWWGLAGEELHCEGPLHSDSRAAFAQVARRFHAGIRDGAEPEPSLIDGLRVQAVMDALRTAAEQRCWVEVQQP
jgi:predicted dehydrogenase